MSADQYDNPDTKEELDEKRKQLERHDKAQQAEAAAEHQGTRSALADEDQPDPSAPDLRETYTVAFRGHDFEFYELGDAALEAAQYQDIDDDDIEQGTEAAQFMYRTLGDKAVTDAIDAAYWRQYDFGDVMDVFFELIEQASDVDEAEAEEIRDFRGE